MAAVDMARIDRTAEAVRLAAEARDSPVSQASRPRAATGWPELEPLPELPDAEPASFPFDALGSVLGPAARAIADAVQAPDSLAAGSVLAAAAVAAQAHAIVHMPHGQVAPLSVFVVTSAGSGDRKSATDSVACSPIEEQRRREARLYAQAAATAKAEKREPPIPRSIVVSKGTVEGLHRLLSSQPCVGLFSTEGAELLGGHSMREERRMAGVAWMLKAWGAETLDSLTRGEGLSVLIGRRLSMHVLVQPIVLQTLMTDPLAQGQGWVARCLIAAPVTLAGTRMFRDYARPASESEAVRLYYRRLDEQMRRPPKLAPGGDGCELECRVIGMSQEARALWVEFYDEVERQQAEGAPLAGVRPWASKAAEHAARIAGIVTIVNDPDATEVSGATMAGAIEVADFYLSEHVRLMGQSAEHLHAHRLRAVLTWMQERRPKVQHGYLLQHVTRSVRALKAEGIKRLLDELAQRGYVRRVGEQWEVRP